MTVLSFMIHGGPVRDSFEKGYINLKIKSKEDRKGANISIKLCDSIKQ